MGYITYYFGKFDLSRQLTPQEIQTIKEKHPDVFPSYFDWHLSEDGKHLLHPRREKYYDAEDDLQSLIDDDLLPIGVHVTGKMGYRGEEWDDYGYLEVKDDEVENVSMAKHLDRIIKKKDFTAFQSLIDQLKKLGVDINYEALLSAIIEPDYVINDNNYNTIKYLADQGEINVFDMGILEPSFVMPTKLEHLKFILEHGGIFEDTFDQMILDPATEPEVKDYVKKMIHEDPNLADPNTDITNLMISAYQGLLDRIGFYLCESMNQTPDWFDKKQDGEINWFDKKLVGGVDRFGNSALHYAAAGNQRNAFFLLNPYSDFLLKNKYGKTPLDYIPKRVLWDWACRGQARDTGFGKDILIHVYKFNENDVIRMSRDKVCSTLREIIFKSMAKDTLMDPEVLPRDVGNIVYQMTH